MKLRLSELASIAEVISGVAVLVTLIFLILQIRENTEITRAATFDRNIESVNQVREWIINDPRLAESWFAYYEHSLADLSEQDERQLIMAVIANFGIYEKSYYAHQRDLMSASEWERFETQICTQHENASIAGFLTVVLDSLTREFREEIGRMCGPGHE